MAKEKTNKEASQLFQNIIKASVKGKAMPKKKTPKKKKPNNSQEEKGMSEVRKWKRSQGL